VEAAQESYSVLLGAPLGPLLPPRRRERAASFPSRPWNTTGGRFPFHKMVTDRHHHTTMTRMMMIMARIMASHRRSARHFGSRSSVRAAPPTAPKQHAPGTSGSGLPSGLQYGTGTSVCRTRTGTRWAPRSAHAHVRGAGRRVAELTRRALGPSPAIGGRRALVG